VKIYSVVSLILCFFSVDCYSQAIQSFVPEGWAIFHQTFGDLNKDSIDDVAVIIENTSGQASESEKSRALLILFKNKTHQYTMACQAGNVILGKDDGGLLGDPFQSMEIKRNVLRVDFSGGSSMKWSTTHRYRFQGNAFFVIGATYLSEYDGVTTVYDYNLSNGKMIITKTDAQNRGNNTIVNKTHKIVLPLLEQFEPDGVWAVLMPEDYTKTSRCTLQGAGFEDCAHINFSCGDFGNASLYLDQAGEDLWYQLTLYDSNGDTVVNPKYEGKTFEITYSTYTGARCMSEGETTYQLVTAFRLLN
jgi:hypothetical protein